MSEDGICDLIIACDYDGKGAVSVSFERRLEIDTRDLFAITLTGDQVRTLRVLLNEAINADDTQHMSMGGIRYELL